MLESMFSFWGIMTQVIFGGAAIYLIKIGKQNSDIMMYIAGVAFMIVPGFVTPIILNWIFGVPLFFWLVRR